MTREIAADILKSLRESIGKTQTMPESLLEPFNKDRDYQKKLKGVYCDALSIAINALES